MDLEDRWRWCCGRSQPVKALLAMPTARSAAKDRDGGNVWMRHDGCGVDVADGAVDRAIFRRCWLW